MEDADPGQPFGEGAEGVWGRAPPSQPFGARTRMAVPTMAVPTQNVQAGGGRPLVELFPAADTVGILADEFDNDASNSEDEGIDDYVKGGYHPVFKGEVLNGRYVILQKLGWGHFSTVWLSRDIKFGTYVAIKIQKSESRYLEAAFDEVEILQKAVKQAHNPDWLNDLRQIYHTEPNRKFESDDCHVVQLLNAFIYQGPYGRHFCMVFEILGVNLLEIIKRYDYKGIPLPICKEIGKQVLIGLHYLHKYCGIIHTDLKPENVMVCLNPEELKQIVESGQLNSNKKIERRLNAIKNKIRELKGEPPLPAEATNFIEEPFVPEPAGEQRVEQSESEKESLNGGTVSRGIRITNEEELNREFETMCSIRNITNKNEKKNLKKRLKKKLRQFNKEALKGFKGSMKQNMAPPQPEERRPPKVRINENPVFAKSGLTDNFRIKIADLGNGCWTHHHFQPEIQTRQYRSPETILGINYNDTCDIWSFACMLFEMLTGEFLFDPHKTTLYSKSTDHLKLMMEMLNRFPREYSTVGTQSKKFVDSAGNFKKVAELNFKTMRDVLVKRYRADPAQADALQAFLMPMLDIYPQSRISAFKSLFDPWLEVKEGEQFFREAGDDEPESREFEPVLDLPDEFGRVVDQDEFDADKSNVSNTTDEAETKDELEYQSHPYEREIKFFDRNFKNVYVGYADGIDLNHLDNTANWQFEMKHH